MIIISSNTIHSPQFYMNPGSSSIVLFIHGFMGSPQQLCSLAQAVHQNGYSAATLLLPGHGGSARDFTSSTFEGWQRHVDSKIERFSADFENIWLVGHSMGGLLAINSAVSFSRSVRGIFTIACPFRMSMFSPYAIRIRFKQVISKKSDPMRIAYLTGSSVTPSLSLIWYGHRPTSELKKLMSAARSNLSQVHIPVTAVYSTSDELTSILSLDILKAELTAAPLVTIVLTDSLHAYYPEKEQSVIKESLLRFLWGISPEKGIPCLV